MIGKTNSKVSGGGGGGSFGYNFNIIRYSEEPSAPAAECTIGVVTDNIITDFILSANTPASPSAGLVWIVVGGSSSISIFADSNKKVEVYPKSVKQYVSGEWVNKDAYIYINGQWQSFYTYYFARGSGAYLQFVHSAPVDWGTVTVDNESIHIDNINGGDNNSECGFHSNETINVTELSTIFFRVKVVKGTLTVGLNPSIIMSYNNPSINVSSGVTGSNEVVLSIDVSAYSGEYYIIGTHNHQNGKESYIYDIYAR